MERKCEILGTIFQVSAQELKFCRSHSVPFPKRIETERLRYLLSLVPDLNICMQARTKFYLSANNNYIPSVKCKNLSPVPFTLDQFPDLTGESCFAYLGDLFNFWRGRKTDIPDSLPNYSCYNSTNIYDSCFCNNSENILNCVFVDGSKRLYAARYSRNCQDSYFIENCEDCSFCLFSSNLKGKKYFVFNNEVSEQEYNEIFDSLLLSDPLHLEAAHERYGNFLKTQAYEVSSFKDCEKVSGRFINNGKNAYEVFFSNAVKDSSLIFAGQDVTNSLALVLSGSNVSDSYQSALIVGPAKGIRNSYLCGPGVSELDYCIGCRSSSNLMFSVGLENAKFCIFNQQLSEHQYFIYRDRIKKMFSQDIEWGNQMPLKLSMVAYNESLANIFFPLSKVQAMLLGFEWNDDEDVIKFDRYGSQISICEISGEAFKISDIEIRLRSRLGLAPPNRAPGQRFKDLLMSTEFGPKKESSCAISSKPFSHFYRGSRLVIS